MAGYGGWLDHNFFLVIHGSTRDDQAGDVSVPVAVSIGDATGTNPTSIGGTATWSGIMIGTDVNVTTTPTHQLRGDADITIADFMNPSVDVAFTNIRNLNTGDIRNDMTWNGIPLTAGGFRQGVDEDSIQGAFFGPNHGEVGGVFERDQVIGAFGANRQ
ncbi:MAG: transferrin-binding protein-like solute binding protein [Paracoccaceae bacterium]|nr:transferrin-binding protein-like solute binding protein [Paracoccaceae bacterium]